MSSAFPSVRLNHGRLWSPTYVCILTARLVYCLYPESSQRTLEEMNLLFASPTPWAWDAEKTFATLKAEMGETGEAKKGSVDIEAKAGSTHSDHVESS